jgi:hypothetical protein
MPAALKTGTTQDHHTNKTLNKSRSTCYTNKRTALDPDNNAIDTPCHSLIDFIHHHISLMMVSLPAAATRKSQCILPAVPCNTPAFTKAGHAELLATTGHSQHAPELLWLQWCMQADQQLHAHAARLCCHKSRGQLTEAQPQSKVTTPPAHCHHPQLASQLPGATPRPPGTSHDSAQAAAAACPQTCAGIITKSRQQI